MAALNYDNKLEIIDAGPNGLLTLWFPGPPELILVLMLVLMFFILAYVIWGIFVDITYELVPRRVAVTMA